MREEFASHHVPESPVVVTEEDPLSTLIEAMATKHIHRVFVVDSRQSMKPIRVIAQTDLLRAILKGISPVPSEQGQ